MGPTSPTNRRDRSGGFTLIELMLALAVMALIAGLALPRVYPGSGAANARVTAYSVAALLRADRNAAIRTGTTVTTRIAPDGVSGSAGGVTIAPDIALSLRGAPDGSISFLPDGRSSGGAISLRRDRTVLSVLVNPLTGGVQIVTGGP